LCEHAVNKSLAITREPTMFRLELGGISMTTADQLKMLTRLKRIARFMDAGWGIPFTKFRFGADSVLGLVPGAGDVVAMFVSIYVLVKAHEMGAPKPLLMKMAGNIAIDTGLGAVPVLGDVFDMFFKSNVKNVDLLHDFITKNQKS
jgi:Domain of unknown function (DUF4112)